MGTLIIYGAMFLVAAALIGGLLLFARGRRDEQARGESHPPR